MLFFDYFFFFLGGGEEEGMGGGGGGVRYGAWRRETEKDCIQKCRLPDRLCSVIHL